MSRQEQASPEATAPTRPAGGSGPYWRALLEARWRARLRELIELSLAYHGAEASGGVVDQRADQLEIQALLDRAVEARWKLADVEEALSRLTNGGFGHCEQCGSAIPAPLLAVIPETRYCPRCDPEPIHVVARRGRR